MSASDVQRASMSISIPCIINRASLGDADYVFVVLRNLAGQNGKVAWVPREDLLVDEQRLLGGELTARLNVRVKEEREHAYVVALVNSGLEETLSIPKMQ
jgi:hypothetical protein